MPLKLLLQPLSLADLQLLADERFGDMVKAVVDVNTEVVAVGCELHVDAEQLLIEHGSKQEDIWGINLYPASFGDIGRFVEFDSMINLRPSQGNRSRGVEDQNIRQKILNIVRQQIISV